MLFNYKALDTEGNEREGSLEAHSQDTAIADLQRQGLTITELEAAEEGSLLEMNLTFFERVSNRDIVIVSRQIATLFEAQVSALRIFRLLATESANPALQRTLTAVADDLQAGSSISKAMSRHPKVFSAFYVSMVRSGEETGKLDEIFMYLADYLDRTYEVTTKARNAMIYPAFVVLTFIVVVILMLVLVFPKIGAILEETGQEVPIYTRIILGMGDFIQQFGFVLLLGLIVALFFGWRWYRTESGKYTIDTIKLKIPVIGDLYRKLYLSRIADNLSTMLSSGITVVRALEVTADVVGNAVYEEILRESLREIKNGAPVSRAFSKYPEMPGILVQMIKVGEETGELGSILNTLAHFYRREVSNAVDTLVDMIEPAMIVVLGVGVGVLLASVLLPIYNITTSI